jgi:leucyl aminopeptidase
MERKIPVNIIAILPITDNAVANNAYLPSDVIKAYNGKTIEVLDTDAEGRMTLADGLSYLSKNYKTDVLLDLATLTGSSVRMFGYTCGALFSNDKNLKNALENAGDKTNQRLWNLPLWDIWKDEISSDVADYKNISMKPFGDCIVAAKVFRTIYRKSLKLGTSRHCWSSFRECFLCQRKSRNWLRSRIINRIFGNIGS